MNYILYFLLIIFFVPSRVLSETNLTSHNESNHPTNMKVKSPWVETFNTGKTIGGFKWKSGGASGDLVNQPILFKGKIWVIDGQMKSSQIWCSEDGKEWHLVAKGPQSLGRRNSAILLFDDKLWVIGGWGTKPNEYIWCSVDGVHWKNLTHGFDFKTQPFCFTQAVVLNNEIWIFDSTNEETHVWHSKDGQKWEEVSETIDFHQDYVSHNRIFVFKNKIWNPSIANESFSVSRDGIQWPYSTIRFPSSGISDYVCSIFQGKLWMIGWFGSDSFYNSVWCSKDGIHWTSVGSRNPFKMSPGSFLAPHNGKLFLFQGEGIWSSSDGVHWELLKDSSTPLGFPLNSTLVYQKKIWALGSIIDPSMGDQGVEENYCVWNSTDGKNWVKVTNNAPFGVEGTHRFSLSFGGKIVVIGEKYWSSKDGLNWDEEFLSFFDAKGQQIPGKLTATTGDQRAFVFAGKIWVIVDGKIWSSKDGKEWTLRNEKLPFYLTDSGVRKNFSVAVFDSKVWVIGGEVDDGEEMVPQSDLWSSEDGVNWKLEAKTTTMGPRSRNQAVVYNDQLYILGGNGTKLDEVWSSKDGKKWVKDEKKSPMPARLNFSCVNFDGKIWILGGESNTRILDDVWCLP